MTWSIASVLMPASRIAAWNGALVRSSREAVICWNWARVTVCSRCSGPSAVAVMNGRFTDVSVVDDSSFFAFSAASFSRCAAILSLDRSTPWLSLNVLTSQSMSAWSQSSPPRWVSPEVDLTSNTPSAISSTDTSKVPPPRS